MENSLYYTFSTISQVLSAFIALSGVFVIFKLSELKKMQLVRAQDFIDHVTLIYFNLPSAININNINSAVKSESIADIAQEINKINNGFKDIKDDYIYLKTIENNIIKIEKFKSLLKKLTIISLFIGILTITYSLIILSCTTIIKNNYFQTFSIGILSTIACIGFMTVVIILSLRDYKLISNSLN